MANVVKTDWFGKRISVLMVNGETVSGELTEVSDHYVVLDTGKADVQIMVGAMVAVRLAQSPGKKQQAAPPAAGVPTFE
jgi:small nuclear ribonucleoprotein (snRNP)-like protein